MSWISDAFGKVSKGASDFASFVVNDVAGASSVGRDVANFIQREWGDKSDLRGAQAEALLSGVPYVGGLLKGVDNAQQMEDLYNNTGKTSAYPAVQSSGLSSAGKSIPGLARKIEAGTHDLFEHYSGTKDDTSAILEEGMKGTASLFN